MTHSPEKITRSSELWRVVLTSDGSRTLRLGDSGITYHSVSGAISESREVFLQNSNILDWPDSVDCLRVLEIGFGTGLNFLLTADALRRGKRSLNYQAFDKQLVPRPLLRELAYEFAMDDPSLLEQMIEQLHQRPATDNRYNLRFNERVSLRLVLGDARAQFISCDTYHAIYHDPFGPAVNGELWQPPFLQRLFNALVPGGHLTSYCVKSTVQKDLRKIGFQVDVRSGPAGGKRQVLVAIRAA